MKFGVRANVNGCPMSALRIYPMSPHVDSKIASELAHDLSRMKAEFDKVFNYLNESAPDVVHK